MYVLRTCDYCEQEYTCSEEFYRIWLCVRCKLIFNRMSMQETNTAITAIWDSRKPMCTKPKPE